MDKKAKSKTIDFVIRCQKFTANGDKCQKEIKRNTLLPE